MDNQTRANVSIRIYQLERKLEQLRYDEKRAYTNEDWLRARTAAREIELLLGF